jgi:hypothetical protein
MSLPYEKQLVRHWHWWIFGRPYPLSPILLGGPSWSWSYGSWINIFLCNQCLSPLKLWVRTLFMARCTRYNIMWSSLPVICSRSVVFSGYSNWPTRYNWNSVESGVKHHNPNPILCMSWLWYGSYLGFYTPTLREGAILQSPCPSVHTFVTVISASTGRNDFIFDIWLWHDDLYRVSPFQAYRTSTSCLPCDLQMNEWGYS